MGETTMRRNPLRRFRELICLGAAALLLVATWAANQGAFDSARGHSALLGLAVLEGAVLGGLFWLEHRRRRPAWARRWITVAWASLPIWVCLDVVVAGYLRATS